MPNVPTLHDRFNNDSELIFEHILKPLKGKAIKTEIEEKRFKKFFMARIHHKIKFDPILIYKCYQIHEKIRKNNDATIVITGATGSGKSTMATQIMCWIIPDFDKKKIISKLLDYVRIYLNRGKHIRKMMIQTKNVYHPEPDGLIMDEGNELRSDEHNRKPNRMFRRLFTIQRFCKMLLIINIPKWHALDKNLRDSDSTDLLIYILKRGKYKGIIGHGIDIVEDKNKKAINTVQLNTKYFWHGYFGSKMPEEIGQYDYEFTKVDSAVDEMQNIYAALEERKEEEEKEEKSLIPV